MAKVREVRRSSKKAIRSATTQVNRNRSPYLAKFVALIKSAMFEHLSRVEKVRNESVFVSHCRVWLTAR